MTEEDKIQSAICDLFRLTLKPPVRYFAIPNGGHRSISIARLLKRTGTTAGVPDLIIMAPNVLCFAEVKTATGRLSPEQTIFRDHILACGFHHAILRSVDDAANLVKTLRLAEAA